MLKVLGIVGSAPGGERFHKDVANNPHGYSAQTKCDLVLLSLISLNEAPDERKGINSHAPQNLVFDHDL